MIGLLALALAVVGTVYFVKFTDENWKWKALMVAMTVTSLILQFAFESLWLPALILQSLVGIWTLVYWKLDR